MKLRPDEITGLIKQQIKDYRSKLELDDVGRSALLATEFQEFMDLTSVCRANFLNFLTEHTAWQ